MLISVLKGGTMFLADLFRRIDLPLRVDFMAISRYGDADESFGRVRILMDVEGDLDGTRRAARGGHRRHGPHAQLPARDAPRPRPGHRSRSARCWTSPCAGSRPLDVRYAGFDCPDRFVVGYGLDHHERYRNLRDIYAVEDVTALDRDPDALVPLLEEAAAELTRSELP